jgi:hypothetical protein
MPRLSRNEASFVISMLRNPALQQCSRSLRLLRRLESALAVSIDAVRACRQETRTSRAAMGMRQRPDTQAPPCGMEKESS